MTRLARKLNAAVAILFALCVCFGPAFADEAHLDELFERLAAPDLTDWESVEDEIWKEWSHSGSDSMDLLLDRGRKAMEDGDWQAAIGHLTALTDHAPEFAEGWNARATAFYNIGMLGPSIEDIERTLALNPRHFGAMSGLGMILRELGYDAEALGMFQRALALNPHRPDLQEAVDQLDREIGGTEL